MLGSILKHIPKIFKHNFWVGSHPVYIYDLNASCWEFFLKLSSPGTAYLRH